MQTTMLTSSLRTPFTMLPSLMKEMLLGCNQSALKLSVLITKKVKLKEMRRILKMVTKIMIIVISFSRQGLMTKTTSKSQLSTITLNGKLKWIS